MPQFQQLYKFVAVLPDDKYNMQLFKKICCNVFQLPIQYPPRTYWSTVLPSEGSRQFGTGHLMLDVSKNVYV
jgi:hypothetical protein